MSRPGGGSMHGGSMLRGIASNWAINALQIVVLLYLTPYVLGKLGAELNGVWIAIVSMTGVLRLLVLGVPMASVRSIASAVGRKDQDGVNRAVSTCLGLTTGMAVAALAIGLLQLRVFDSSYLRGALGEGLGAEQLAAARTAFVLSAVQVATAFAARLPYGILEAHDDFVGRNAVMAGELALRLGLTVTLLPMHASLETLAAIQVTTMLAEFAAAWARIRLKHPGVRLGFARFDRSLVGGILSFSVFAMLLNVGTLLAFRCDALVIGAFLDARATTEFDMGNKFFEPLTGFVIAIGAVVMPAATRLAAAGARQELAPVLLRWSKISFTLVLAVGLYLLVLGPEFLGVWTGPEFSGPSGSVLRILMASFLVYLPVRGVALPILMGLGQPARPALALLAMGIANVIVSVALVGPFGLAGVALGTSIPNLVFAAYVALEACREIGVPVGRLAGYALLKPLVGGLPPLAALLAWKFSVEVDTWIELIGAGVTMVAAFAVAWPVFVLRGDPFIELPARVRALLGRPAGDRAR